MILSSFTLPLAGFGFWLQASGYDSRWYDTGKSVLGSELVSIEVEILQLPQLPDFCRQGGELVFFQRELTQLLQLGDFCR